jgi:hypothetical protein
MTISKYLFLTLIVIGSLTYSSKIPAQYESAAMGATIGAVAGAILTSCSPIGLLGGLTVGGLIGHRMESSAASND